MSNTIGRIQIGGAPDTEYKRTATTSHLLDSWRVGAKPDKGRKRRVAVVARMRESGDCVDEEAVGEYLGE